MKFTEEQRKKIDEHIDYLVSNPSKYYHRRSRYYYDFFFVPTRLLWKDFQPMITQMTDNSLRAATIIDFQCFIVK